MCSQVRNVCDRCAANILAMEDWKAMKKHVNPVRVAPSWRSREIDHDSVEIKNQDWLSKSDSKFNLAQEDRLHVGVSSRNGVTQTGQRLAISEVVPGGELQLPWWTGRVGAPEEWRS